MTATSREISGLLPQPDANGPITLPPLEALDALSPDVLPAVALRLAALQAHVAARMLTIGATTAGIVASKTPDCDGYLSVTQLTQRIPYDKQTISNLMAAGVLREGEHYFKPRGRIMFSWAAVRAWIERRSATPGQSPVPLVRDRGHAR